MSISKEDLSRVLTLHLGCSCIVVPKKSDRGYTHCFLIRNEAPVYQLVDEDGLVMAEFDYYEKTSAVALEELLQEARSLGWL